MQERVRETIFKTSHHCSPVSRLIVRINNRTEIEKEASMINGGMTGWMGGGMFIGMTIGVLVVVLLIVAILKFLKK